MAFGRVTRRWVLASTGAAAALPALAACAGVDSQPAKGAAPISLLYYSNLQYEQPEGQGRYELMEEWNRTATEKITVNLSEAKARTELDKLKTLAAAGTPPDFAFVGYRMTGELSVAGTTINYDDELKKEKDWAKQRADIFPAMLGSSELNGKLVGMPTSSNDNAFIYSPRLLQQAGVEPPKQGWTWDQFRDIGRRVSQAPDRWGYTWAWVYWTAWLGTNGARPVSNDGKKITLTTPEGIETGEFMLNLIRSEISPPAQQANLFQTGRNQTVFEQQAPAIMPSLRQAGIEFEVIHTPIKKQLYAPNGGHSMVVFKDIPPERKRAAALVSKWVNAPHGQAQLSIKGLALPTTKGGLESKELQDHLKTDRQFKAFVDLAANGWRWPALPSFTKIVPIIDAGWAAIFSGKSGVRDALASAEREAQAALDEDLRNLK
jgi:multiple sugar transport system substrate-binding protein